MNILDLPDTVLMDIMEWLTYDEVAKKREICTRFNYIGQQVLNTGFNKIILEHSKNFKRIKSMLPRRESERRNHCLARHSDILTSIETRISMLTMTYSKYIDLNICCFIPGRVLDEIVGILKLLSSTSKPLRPHEVLQELRDISSMAIEHFDEKIAANFKTEHRNKLVVTAGGTRAACGGLADISFSGVKRAQQTCNNVLCISQKAVAIVQQARLLANTLPANANSKKQTRNELVSKHFKKQNEMQKRLLKKIRNLENARKNQDQRMREAVGTITELGTQVSELKRQLEDVVASKCSGLSVSSTAKRPASSADCLPAVKKSKV